MVVRECDAAAGFLPVFKDFVSAHVEKTLVFHESALAAADYIDTEHPAQSPKFYGIPVEAPIGTIALDEQFAVWFPEQRL
jgi:hypothetical protein